MSSPEVITIPGLTGLLLYVASTVKSIPALTPFTLLPFAVTAPIAVLWFPVLIPAPFSRTFVYLGCCV